MRKILAWRDNKSASETSSGNFPQGLGLDNAVAPEERRCCQHRRNFRLAAFGLKSGNAPRMPRLDHEYITPLHSISCYDHAADGRAGDLRHLRLRATAGQ